jgi:hypothetical protein
VVTSAIVIEFFDRERSTLGLALHRLGMERKAQMEREALAERNGSTSPNPFAVPIMRPFQAAASGG